MMTPFREDPATVRPQSVQATVEQAPAGHRPRERPCVAAKLATAVNRGGGLSVACTPRPLGTVPSHGASTCLNDHNCVFIRASAGLFLTATDCGEQGANEHDVMCL